MYTRQTSGASEVRCSGVAWPRLKKETLEALTVANLGATPHQRPFAPGKRVSQIPLSLGRVANQQLRALVSRP